MMMMAMAMLLRPLQATRVAHVKRKMFFSRAKTSLSLSLADSHRRRRLCRTWAEIRLGWNWQQQQQQQTIKGKKCIRLIF